jgi:hypothetical protein
MIFVELAAYDIGEEVIVSSNALSLLTLEPMHATRSYNTK